MNRGHLVAARFDGSNTNSGRFAAVFRLVNLSAMRKNENAINGAIMPCSRLYVTIRPNYQNPTLNSAALWAGTPPQLPVKSITYFGFFDIVFSPYLAAPPKSSTVR